MKVDKLDIIDWEPATVHFVWETLTSANFQEFREFAEHWLQVERPAKGVCRCKLRFVEFIQDSPKREIVLRSEWMCQACVQALAEKASARFSQLRRAQLGLAVEQPNSSTELIRIPEKTVEFENGFKSTVASFTIAKRPVTIRQFEAFCAATGYVTKAEKDTDSENFRQNCALSGLSKTVRLERAATFVTYRDAIAFCDHAGVKLPSEAQWLAAAVNDPSELQIDNNEELRLRLQPLASDAIECRTRELTGDLTSDGMVVTRSGPLHFVRENWRSRVSIHRKLVSQDEFDISIAFRTVLG